MQQHILPQLGIRAIAYDVDNCIAPLSNNDITDGWDIHLADEFGLTREEATRKRRHYFDTVGCTLKGYAKEYGRTQDWIDSVYANYGTESGQRFVNRHTPSPLLADLFRLIHERGIRQMIVTQGHPNHYRPIIDHLGLTPYVEEDDRIDRTKPPYEKLEAEVWHRVLARHNLQPHQVMVLEDTPRNLVHPAALGMHTVLIGNRDVDAETAPSIHYRYPDAEAALEILYPRL